MILKKIKKNSTFIQKVFSIFFFLIYGRIKSVITPGLHDEITVFEIKKNDIV